VRILGTFYRQPNLSCHVNTSLLMTFHTYAAGRQDRFRRLFKAVWRDRYLLLLISPVVLYYLIFHYVPMYGTILAWTGHPGPNYFRTIYIAALAGIDPNLYEAAEVDGAKRRQKAFYSTLPSMQPIMVILLILNVGSLMVAGFSLDAYELVFEDPGVWRAYYITIWYTGVGTLINVPMTVLAAYPLSKPILAVLALFYAVGHWNDSVYLPSMELQPLSIFLSNVLLQNNQEMFGAGGITDTFARSALAIQMKYSLIIVVILPIVCVFSTSA
jgi:ABC-type sugar transport system permease subunit